MAVQVAFIDVTKQSPCGHGKVICLSIYGGEDLHFDNQPPINGQKKTTLWIDTYFDGQDVSCPKLSPDFTQFFLTLQRNARFQSNQPWRIGLESWRSNFFENHGNVQM